MNSKVNLVNYQYPHIDSGYLYVRTRSSLYRYYKYAYNDVIILCKQKASIYRYILI